MLSTFESVVLPFGFQMEPDYPDIYSVLVVFLLLLPILFFCLKTIIWMFKEYFHLDQDSHQQNYQQRINSENGSPRIFTIDDPRNADFSDFYYIERATNEKIDKDLPTYDEVMEMERERYQSPSPSPPSPSPAYTETIFQYTPQETSNIVPLTSVSTTTTTTATTTISTGSSTISHVPR